MTEHSIDERLTSWSEISDYPWDALLLGNGFSVNIWERFGYGTLYELAQSEHIDERLNDASISLFEHVGSANFEDVLRILFHALLVDERMENKKAEQIRALYTNTKNALASAVNFAHVPYGRPDLHTLNRELRHFREIFSTNYDLIPYWSIMYDDVWRFKDYFWGTGGTFDISDTAVPSDRTKVHYLHGAIHLVERWDRNTQKRSTNEIDSLRDLFDIGARDTFPLFITEGHWKRKLSRIKDNDYLRFCFERFASLEGSLVVIGQSLHKEYDKHIVDAISGSAIDRVAVGIWPHQTPQEIVAFKSRIANEVREKQLHFFDSETHPISSPDLRCEI